ncbi:MAG: GNAT family N-acetyltransferase [Nevskiaceae bacterium]|nr:MAG: GNAT family N-acetyltransferase [Nevskiaceae bacterium]
MQLQLHEGIAGIPAERWDALFDPAYPFTRHGFLKALEDSGCVAADTGWQACHATLTDTAGTLRAAVPLYLKHHSYGEFVFDWSWAEASQRMGHPYYPKLLCAVPFTPATGPRFGTDDDGLRPALAAALGELPRSLKTSSAHLLFAADADAGAALAAGAMPRHDVQYHWHNRGYADFADFVAQLRADKRKKLLRERRRIAEGGLRFEVLPGETIAEPLWAEIYALYANTYEERGQPPYLNLRFFLDYGMRSGSPLRIILCREGARLVACAITVRGGDTLYGRHWGAAERYHSLHFETCYYQGIDYCIREGLKRYDAGAQGEHKLARGFEPVRTQSLHWLRQPRLAEAVEHYLRRERALVETRLAQLRQHSPYRTASEDGDG